MGRHSNGYTILYELNSNIGSLANQIANLHFLPVTITDTIASGETLTPGVSLSTLTGGVITNQAQIKGFCPFNNTANYLDFLQYQNKIVMGVRTAVSQATQISVKAVIMY